MKLLTAIRTNRAYRPILAVCLLLLSLFLLFIAWFISRGVLRNDILPGYYKHRYQHIIRGTVDADTKEINTAFRAVGIQFDQPAPVHCDLDVAVTVHTSIWCGTSSYSGHTYTRNSFAVAADITKAGTLLKKQGWSETVDRLLGDAPDVPVAYNYSKKQNSLTCRVWLEHDMNGQLRGEVSCSRTFLFMGDPYKYY